MIDAERPPEEFASPSSRTLPGDSRVASTTSTAHRDRTERGEITIAVAVCSRFEKRFVHDIRQEHRRSGGVGRR